MDEVSKKDNLIADDNFFDWLIQQMDEHFYVLYDETNNNDKTKKIPLLYKIVYEYAMKRHLPPIKLSYYNIYYLNYHQHIFSIFEHVSSTNYEYGCANNFLEKSDIRYFINLDDVRNSQDELTRVLKDEINERIQSLYDNGVSIDLIREMINELCNEIETSHTK